MVRKSLVAMAAAMSLVAGAAQAAPARVASPISDSENLTDEDAWIVPAITILAVILIILLDNDDGQDAPVSP